MRYEVLGPLRVTVDGGELALGGPQQRLVLALLIQAAGRVVQTGSLIEGVWGESEPATAKKTLQGYVHHLRSQVGEALRTEGGGYSLDTQGNVDAIEFAEVHRQGRSVLQADPTTAAEHFRAALNLWRGTAFADLDGRDGIAPEIVRLESLRVTALGDRLDADLACGSHEGLIGELEGLTQEFPLQERFRSQHMLALFRAGRHVEALRSYERMRRFLADELGLQPSIELQQLEQRILDGDSTLELDRRSHGGLAAVRGYELRELVSSIKSVETYRAYQRSVGREVEIRVLGPKVADDPTFIATFLAETRRIAALEHAHIALVHDTWREPGRAYQVSRWFNRHLSDQLSSGALSVAKSVRVLDQVGGALAYAHRHDLVHGRVDPAHVGLDADGTGFLTGFLVGAGAGATQTDDRLGFAAMAHATLAGRAPKLSQGVYQADLGGAGLTDAVIAVIEKGLDFEGEYLRVDDFLRALRQATGADTVAPIDSVAPARRDLRNPYKGLRAFQESDAADFYGRDELVERLVDRLDATRLVAVVGPSGAGKSSAVKAGLAAQLRRTDDGVIRLLTDMYPGAFPFEELAGALLRVGVDRESVIDDLVADERGLLRVLKQILPPGDSELWLVIDQFEELFSMVADRDVMDLFLDSLTTAITDPRSRIRVVITMRADFFDKPLENPRFGALMEAGLVPVTSPDAMGLAAAIAQPAISVGLELEDGLTDRIVRDLDHQPGGLPLLQYAMTEMVEQRNDNRLTFAGYEAIGGVFGALGRRAEDLYQALTPAAQDAIRQAFLRMVSVDETTNDLRRRVTQAELAAADVDVHALNDALQAFGGHRLLTFDRDPVTRARTVEVAHEALTREWQRLASWITNDRADLIVRRRLDAALAEWKKSGDDPSYLPTGGRLAHFQEWSDTTTLSLSNDERALLEAGSEREREQQAKARNRRLGAFAALSVATVALAGLTVFAFAQRSNADAAAEDARQQAAVATEQAILADNAAEAAEEQRDIAEAQGLRSRALQLASLAENTLIDDPELAIHLALESEATERLAGVELSEVTSALYNATFANRRAARLQSDVGPGFFLMSDGINQINAAGSQGMQPTAEVDPFGLFPTSVEVIALSDGSVLGMIEDPSGLSSFQWDPVTGEILTLSLSGQISWLDSETFEVVRTLTVQEGAMFLERVGDLITYGALTNVEVFDLQTHVIDARTGEELFTGPPDAFISHLSPSGEMVAILDDSVFIRVFDIATGEVVNVLDVTFVEPLGWRWSATSDEIIHGIEPGYVQVVDPRSGEVVLDREAGFFLFFFIPSPDGRLLAAVGLADTILLLDGETFEQVEVLPFGDSQANNVAWSADSTTLVSSHVDGSSIVWDLGEVVTAARSVPRIADSLIRTEFVRDGQLLVASAGGGGELLDRATGEVLRRFAPRDNSATIPLATFIRSSRDGDLVAISQDGASVAIIDLADGSTRAVTTTDHHQVFAMSGDGTRVHTGASSDIADSRVAGGGYAVHDTATGEVVYSSTGAEGRHEYAGAGVFAPNGDLFATVSRVDLDESGTVPAGQEETLLVVHAADGTLLLEHPIEFELVDLQISSDGTYLAGLDYQGILRIYDTEALRSGEGVTSVLASADVGLFSIAISPDDTFVVSGGNGALTAHLVDEGLREAWSIDVREGDAGFVAFEGGYVWMTVRERMARNRDADIGLVGFPLDRGEIVAFAESKLSRDLTEEECRQYLGLDSCDDRLVG